MNPCPLCGKMHEQPFSKEMLDLHDQVRGAADPDDRAEASYALVDLFSGSFDPLDDGWPEDMHNYVDSIAEAEMELDRAKRALGRVLVRSIDSYKADHEEAADEEMPAVSKREKGPSFN